MRHTIGQRQFVLAGNDGRVVLIDGATLRAVGEMGRVEIPARALVLDVAGHRVVSGLVGLDDHLYDSYRELNVRAAVGTESSRHGFLRMRYHQASMTTERRTRQRGAVRAALEATGAPMRAQEIHRLAAHRAPGIGLATVYRTLRSMIASGDVVPVSLPGDTPRYELAHRRHHHHFRCRRCGGVFEVDGCPGDLTALAPAGFSVDGHEVVLYGRCSVCAA